jgi:hypothetical protein
MRFMMKDDNSTQAPLKLDDLLERADEFARREPAQATVAAFGAGFLVNLLPLGAIAGALTGVAFSLLRPALLFLGILKICELYRNHQSASSHE